MQLDDLIKQERLGNITKKTHITKVVLEKMLNREFESLQKSQVYGILSVLEREYEVKLDEFRDESEEYFSANTTEDNGFVVMEAIPQSNHFLLRFFVLLLIVAIVYGGWYYFHSYYKPSALSIDPQNEKTLIDIILEGKDTIIEKVSGKNSETIEDQKTSDQNRTLETHVKIDAEAIATQTPKIQETPAREVKQIVTQTPKIAQESIVPNAQSTEDTKENETSHIAIENKPVDADRSVDINSIKREKITILPQKVMNFKLVNIQTKKILKFKRKDQYDINVKNSSWLYSSEDTVFAFIDNDIFEEHGGEGSIFFRLDKDGIHPLTQDEYKIALK